MDELRWLLIDSCGATAMVAVGHGEVVLGSEAMVGRAFSAEWPGVLRRLMAGPGGVDVVGVVHGPGSFTGVRVGLAAAKGLCEAVGAKLVAVSRLEVLAAIDVGSVVAMDAGRGEFYMWDGGVEELVGLAELVEGLGGRRLVTPDAKVAEAVGGRLVEIEAWSALPIVLARVRDRAFDDVASIDANYVRGERDIYATPGVSGVAK